MSILLKLFASLYTKDMRRLEKKIGYRVIFSKIPKTWINGVVTCSMEKSWAKHGIKAQGVNYWTLGSLDKDGVSSGLVRNDKQYQSWLGAYLVKFKEDREFTLQDHFDLAVADQKNWLEDFGDPEPFIEMPVKGVTNSEPIMIGEYLAMLYQFQGGPSHTDVGKNVNNLHNRILMALASAMFDKSNKKLKIKKSNLIPKNIPTNYETVMLTGYIAIVELSKNIRVVLYGNGAVLLDDRGEEQQNYTSFLKEDILNAFRAVEIVKV